MPSFYAITLLIRIVRQTVANVTPCSIIPTARCSKSRTYEERDCLRRASTSSAFQEPIFDKSRGGSSTLKFLKATRTYPNLLERLSANSSPNSKRMRKTLSCQKERQAKTVRMNLRRSSLRRMVAEVRSSSPILLPLELHLNSTAVS